MGATKIEWADAVWNPVTGCTKVSAGCANCYAERMAKRFRSEGVRYNCDGKPVQFLGKHEFSIVLMHPDRLDQPLHWRKPRRVFVCSMGDLFHGDVPLSFIEQVWRTMHNAHTKFGHTFMILTKRPERMMTALGPSGIGWYACDGPVPRPEPGIWLGVSVENQETADERIPLLLQTPASVRFVSVEPMLGPVDLSRYLYCDECNDLNSFRPWGKGAVDDQVSLACGGKPWATCWKCYEILRLNWVICGGETGPGARPMNPAWPRALRDQCQAAGVPFFFKQMSRKAAIPDDLMVRQFPCSR